MNKNYPIYNTTFIDDMRSLVEEAAQNFPDSIAISYKDKPSDKEVKKVTFSQWREDVRYLGTALVSNGLREQNIAIVGENTYGWCCSFFAVMGIGSVTVPVDKELPIEDINGIITTTGCKAVIYGKTAEEKIKAILADEAETEGGKKVRELMKKWQEVGHVPFKEKDKIYAEYKESIDRAFDKFDMKEVKATLNNYENSISQMTDKDKIYREREFLMRNYEQKRNELKTFENNMGFFNTTSKSGNSMVKEMERRIQKIKDELALIEKKIELIDSKI